MMGFDPLVQFLHELDAVVAFKMAVDRDVMGVFNVVGDGVLPISTVVRLAGRIRAPIPHLLARPASSLVWATRLSRGLPPELIALLRHLCVADGQRARQELGFRAAFTSREAVLDFGDALRLREANLLLEAR
jgi:UDP-glucose 4-epimerase